MNIIYYFLTQLSKNFEMSKNDIERSEAQAELLDLESLQVIKTQRNSLDTIKNKMQQTQVELEAYKFENLKGEQRVQATEKALTDAVGKQL